MNYEKNILIKNLIKSLNLNTEADREWLALAINMVYDSNHNFDRIWNEKPLKVKTASYLIATLCAELSSNQPELFVEQNKDAFYKAFIATKRQISNENFKIHGIPNA